MNARLRPNSSGLHWVRGELDQSLQRARSLIEQHIENTSDALPLQQAFVELHQVRGTASMIQCFGVSALAEEMKQSLQDLMHNRVQETEASFSALLGGIVQLGDHIDALAEGMDDCALILQPAINELRLARGKTLLTEADLFVAQVQSLGLALPAPDAANRAEGGAQVQARKLLPIFHTSLLHWLKNEPDAATALARMGKIAEHVASAAVAAPVYQLYRTVAACVEALLGHALEDSIELKRLFGRGGGQIKLLADEGENVAAVQAGDLSLHLLFFVGRSRGQGPRVSALRKAFNLGIYLPSTAVIEELRRKIHGPNTQLLTRVSEEIRADFGRVKDRIDMAVRTDARAPKDMAETRADLKRISDTLSVLGLNVLQRVVANQAKLLENVGDDNPASTNLWMDLATSILRVEHSLEDALFRQLRKPKDPEKPELEEQVPHSRDLHEGIAALYRESLVNIAKLKTAVDSYVRNNDPAGLAEAPKLLEEIGSGFSIVDSPRAATLIGQLERFAASAAFRSIKEIKPRADRFADAISCVEYYIEAIRDSLPQAGRVLDDLAGYVEQLEFQEEPAPAPAAQEPEAESDAPIDLGAPEPAPAPPRAATPPRPAEQVSPPARQAAARHEVDPEFREVFLEEAGEVRDSLESELPRWTRDPNSRDALTTIRRAFHTLKGSGRMVGAREIGEFGWALEQMLNRCLEGSIAISAPVVATVNDAVAMLPALIEQFRHDTPPAPALTSLLDRAQNLSAGRGEEEEQEPDMIAIFRDDAREKLAMVSDWLVALDRTRNDFPVDHEVVRGYHTLKGAALVVEARAISEFAGALEAYLDSTRDAGLNLSRDAVQFLVEATSKLRDWIEELGTPALAAQNAKPWLRRIKEVQSMVPAHAVQAAAQRQLAEVFASEAFDLVQKIEETSRAWARQPDNRQAPRDLKMLCHTLMGAALMSNCPSIGNTMRALHGRLEECLSRDIVPDAIAFDALAQITEGVYQLLDRFRESDPTGDGAELVSQVYRFNWRSGLAATDFAPSSAESPAAAEEEAADAAFTEEPAVEMPAVEEPAYEEAEAPIEMPELAAEEAAPEEEGPVDPELIGIFLAEAEELMQSLDQHSATLERRPGDTNALAELKRVLHTMKGGARMAGLTAIGDVSHRLESLIEDVERGRTNPDQSLFMRLHSAADGLHMAFDRVRTGEIPDLSSLIADLEGDGAASAQRRVEPRREEPRREEPRREEAPPVVIAPPASAPRYEPAPVEAAPGIDPELAEIFSAEAGELLEVLAEALERWQARPTDMEPVRSMQRALHTFKGGARMAGLSGMGSAAHQMETHVDEFEAGRRKATPEAFDSLRDELDSLQRMHDLLERGDIAALIEESAPAADEIVALADEYAPAPPAEPVAEPVDMPEVASEPEPIFYEAPAEPAPAPDEGALDEFAAPPLEPQPAPPSEVEPVRAITSGQWDPLLFWRPEDDSAALAALRRETARVPVEALDRMLNEAGEISIYRSRLDEHNAGLQAQLNELTQAITRIRDQLRQMDAETDAQIAARGLGQATHTADRYATEFDPLEMDRYTRMQELSRALNESVGDIANLQATMDELTSEAETLLLQQGRVNTEIQQGLMRTLMVPFSRQVARLQRVVRQVALENGKQAEAVFSGVESELDRNVLERMTAPLEHLLRNSVVHGLEEPDERVRNGKAQLGKVAVNLWREGTQLFIEVRDDGRGLDFKAIRDTAIRRGLMPADAQVRDEEIAQFIFEPGFSTAKRLTQDAGRGIGMDVVASEVKQLGGTLELGSEVGKGARFLVRLPLTLAMSQALLVGVGHEQFAIPLPSIEGIARIPREQLDDFYREDGPTFGYGGHQYRVRYLGEFISTPRDPAAETKNVSAILVRLGEGLGATERRIAVVVDQMHGNREVVSKAVGPQVSSIPGVSGATILADGRVVLILDVAALTTERTRRALISLAHGKAEAIKAGEDQRDLIMVVDDSITIRRVTERLLLKHGFRVITAKDGLDAMAQLQTESPRTILLDIEMPKADGFEVAAYVRNNQRISHTPIIMITSRSGDKHRERARSIGVNRYMIKPYQEDELLGEIREVIKETA